jgi:hypothetical protein
MKLLRRILYLWNRGVLERDLQDEMSAHREMLTGDRKRYFGSDLRLRELSREAWGFVWLDQIREDLAYGARQMRRSPEFTLTAIMVLAFGVGLNLSAFQVANAVFYNRIAVRDSPLLQRVIRQSPARKLYAFPSAIASFIVKTPASSPTWSPNTPAPSQSLSKTIPLTSALNLSPPTIFKLSALCRFRADCSSFGMGVLVPSMSMRC